MSFFNPTARINVNKQLGFEYAMLLSFGSHFRSTRCISSARETTMKINYAEMSKDLKAQMKDICDAFAEKIFAPFPKEILNRNVKVSFVRRSDGRQELDFWGDDFVLRLIGKYAGANSLIKAEYRERRGDV